MTAIRNGYLVADGVVHPFGKDSRHIILDSCTKSIVSALIGIAIEEGYLEGVGQGVRISSPIVRSPTSTPTRRR